MAGELQALQDKVTEVEGAAASVGSLVHGLAQYIRDHSSDPAALVAMATQLDASVDTINAAIAANPLPTDPAAPSASTAFRAR